MVTIVDNLGLEELLVPPAFKRGNYLAHLYAPFSIKLNRRVYIYTHDKYNLWVRLEADAEIIKFNERVIPIPISFNDGHAANISPDALSVDVNHEITFHNIVSGAIAELPESTQKTMDAWQNFCESFGYKHKIWNTESLIGNGIELCNIRKLLRYTSDAALMINPILQQSVLSEIGNHRKVIYAKVIQQFPKTDPEEIKVAISMLILSRNIFTDIHLYPLSQTTELSAYHEFSQS